MHLTFLSQKDDFILRGNVVHIHVYQYIVGMSDMVLWRSRTKKMDVSWFVQ